MNENQADISLKNDKKMVIIFDLFQLKKFFDFFKLGQLVRRIDLYEINVDSMNRLIIDPISRGVIVTDGGNKKIWAIGPEGEKKSVQYRPWRKYFVNE